VDAFQQRRLRRAVRLEPDAAVCRRNIPTAKRFFTVTFFYNETAAAVTRSQRLGLLILLIAFIVYVVVRVR